MILNSKRLFVLCLALISVGACSTGGEIKAVSSEDQKVFYKDGREMLISGKKSSIVGLHTEDRHMTFGMRQDFFVAAKNKSNENVVFSTENISALSNELPLKIYSYEDLKSEEDTRQAVALFSATAGGIADSISASRAGYSNTYGTYSGSVYANNGTSAQTFGSYSGSTYDYAAAEAAKNAAEANSKARFAAIEKEGHIRSTFLDQTALKKETIFPQGWVSGFVKIDMPKAIEGHQTITFVVNIAGEEHRLTFALKKKNESGCSDDC